MAYTCELYINSSAPNHLNKVLSGKTVVDNCEFKAPIDVVNPTIYIAATDAYDKYNYMFIPEFGRFYFAKCIGGTSQTLTFQCSSDPLMSFKSAILSSKAVIARNPWKYDKYIPDGKLPVESRIIKGTFKFPQDHFNGNNNSYILTTLGCGSGS